MKLTRQRSISKKILLYLIIYSIVILSCLWLFQVIFLNSYYEWVKTNEVEKIVNKIEKSYNTDEFEEVLDSITYHEGVCLEVIYNNSEIYSSNSINRGCIGTQTNDIKYLQYKQSLIDNGGKKVYKFTNNKLGNKIIMNGIKLDDNYYVIVNAPIQPLNSTISILAGQLVYVTIIVFILSFVIAYFISRHVAEPIIILNNTAKEMAKGDHNIIFKTDSDIQELNSLAQTLNVANKELGKTEELRRELMANVSHDLKTPLTMIKAYAEMVRDLTYKNKEKRNSNLNTIIEETDRLNLLVNDTLELSRLQSNTMELKYEKFDLNDTIKTVVDRFSYLEETKNYKFIYNGIKNAMVNADKIKIEQVIYNLIGNATNYVLDDKTVIINLKSREDKYLVEIIDHGKGIDKKELNLIWDKYYRVDKKHKRNTIGTGLGLSIVKNIFIMHGLEYGVKSKKDKGTTFYFKIKKEK